jgi:hypothetical protein
MPAKWSVDHSRKRVEVVIDGEVTVEEALRFLDFLEGEKAVPYGKLFDARNGAAKINNQVMAAVGQRIATFENPGPISIVLPSRGMSGHAKLFLLAVDADNRARMFNTREEAVAWLDSIKLGD